jgi:hypothetical protein
LFSDVDVADELEIWTVAGFFKAMLYVLSQQIVNTEQDKREGQDAGGDMGILGYLHFRMVGSNAVTN